MSIKRIPLCLNTEDPEQKELYEFVSSLSNGKKRNSSAFLKLLVDREYQKKKDGYLEEKRKFEQQKETLKAPRVEVIKRDIKYLTKNIDKDSDCGTNGSTD
ncbi:hypothetical protein J7E63_12765 [Bacillus sp. ISL-75]|uniref:hypothetical protein n=1 Tax=Bacillus sp. ISL-75 TaxID=2819137 RepID=UPI001BE7609E|nr:hypothetical protein [Bacillus sp. ISL-75]MBT2727810.1 hypothetical protein [Bacillus sp. ISL-75]